MDSAEFHAAVYHVVRQIPAQKVTSYGHVAKLIGMPKHSRHHPHLPSFHPSEALKFLSPNVAPPVPWYRVIGASGTISSRGPGTEGAQSQRETLEAEGVDVADGRTGEMRVDFARWGWFPAVGSINIGTEINEEGVEESRA